MLDQDTRTLLERGVSALERLASDPVIHVESGPPICPHCETMNPMVLVRETEERGKLAEFVITAMCLSCQKFFWAIPQMMHTSKSQEEAQDVLAERLEAGGFDSGDN
jgi:hypothetical protein